jgi:hypothetical protein
MRPGDYVYATTDRAAPPKRMRLLNKIRDTPAGPQWRAEVEVDCVKVMTEIAEQALAPWPPPAAP